MPRKYRVEQPGGIFHVATRAVYERFSFDNAEDRWSFLGVLGEVVKACGWRCKSYCLMGSHYHLILQTPQANLSVGMQLLNGNTRNASTDATAVTDTFSAGASTPC